MKNLLAKLYARVLFYYHHRNTLVVVKENGKETYPLKIKGLHLKFAGKNSCLKIYEPFKIDWFKITLGDDAEVVIGKGSTLHRLSVSKVNQGKLLIGENFYSHGSRIFLHDEAHNFVKIGKDCIFSFDVFIWPSDGHTLYDIETGKVLNRPQTGISIGNHVWLGRGVSVLKNVEIADDVMVGACSLVNRSLLEKNVIAVGCPAKVVRRGVSWKWENTDYFKDGFVS